MPLNKSLMAGRNFQSFCASNQKFSSDQMKLSWRSACKILIRLTDFSQAVEPIFL
jgi:hypothetical protein